MEVISFAYYFLMLAIGLKIIHAFYSHFKKKKRRGKDTEKEKILSLNDDGDEDRL